MREVIFKRLWISNALEARDVKGVLDQGVAAVVDLAIEESPIVFPRDIIYCRIPLVDGAGNVPAIVQTAIDSTINLIRGAVPVLVTCGGGMSRSPAIVAAALAATENTSIDAALKRVAAAGPHDVSPTFWSEIQQMINQRC